MCRVKTWFLLVILFLVIASSGCGGGSGGGGNSQDSSEINGTWEIESGQGIVSADDSGRLIVAHYTYVAGMNSEVSIEMTRNNSSTYYGTNDGLYTLKLEGDNVIGSGGYGALIVKCTVDETGQNRNMNFPSGISFSNKGNGIYNLTGNNSMNSYEYTLTLEDESTLRWVVWNKNNKQTTGSQNEARYEIVLKKAGTADNNNSNNTTPNTNTNIPPQISGTWRVTSGSGTATQTVSGNPFIGHLTYTPEIRTEIGLEITQNDYSTYAGDYVGMYSLTLTGDNVINSGTKGGGSFRVPYTVSEYPEKLYPVTFNGGKAFKYAGNGIYRMTKADIMGYNDNSQGYEYTLTLEDANTLRWQYFIPSDGMYELVLSKAQ